MKRFGCWIVVCGLALGAVAGTGTMTSTPVWDLADNGGVQTVTAAGEVTVPNAKIAPRPSPCRRA